MNIDPIILILAFLVKHFVADFALQSSWMVLGKAQADRSFIKPLLSHSLIHGALTLIIVLIFVGPHCWFLSLVDTAIHFIIDRLKSGPRWAGQIKMMERPQAFWFCFGLDQLLHQITYLGFVYFVCN